jgi:hypothetical protein
MPEAPPVMTATAPGCRTGWDIGFSSGSVNWVVR